MIRRMVLGLRKRRTGFSGNWYRIMNTAVKNRPLIRHISVSNLSAFSTVMAILVLLILLAGWIATPSTKLPGPSVTLPQFDSSFATIVPVINDLQNPRTEDAIVLTITRNMKFFLNDRAVLPEHLQMELGKLQSQTRNPILYLKADKALPYMWVIWTLMRLRTLDIHNVYLAVRAKSRPYERMVQVQLPDWSLPPMIDYYPTGLADGEYVGLEKMSSLTPEDPDIVWFHENTLLIRNNEAVLDKVPITIRRGRKTYSASDGGFLTYRARFIAKDGKNFVALRLCQSDYILFPMNKQDQYTEIKTLPIKVVAGGIEIGSVQYRRTALHKTSLDYILQILRREPLEKSSEAK